LVGTTRYREYMPQAIADDPSLLVAAADQGAPAGTAADRVAPDGGFVIPCTVRPSPVKVLYAVPTFKWDSWVEGTSVVRKRSGRALRLYVEGDWYQTG